jgi:hypothetical protein
MALAVAWSPAAGAVAQTGSPSGPLDLQRLTEGLTLRQERYAPAQGPPIELRFFLRSTIPEQSQRVVAATTSTLRTYGEWFGPFPFPQLVVVDAPWNSGLAGASYPGVIVVSTRWINASRDRSLERTLIGAIARQYWRAGALAPASTLAPASASAPTWFDEGLAYYAGVRVVHQELEGGNYAAHRFFGGFVPFALRSVLWSPNPSDPRPRVRRFPEISPPDGQAARAMSALQTLERYIGWPALQQAIEAYRQSGTEEFPAVLRRQTGRDFSWFFDEAFRFPARFDYGVDRVSSEPSPETPATFVTTVVLRRFGDGIFAGTNEPRDALPGGARSLPVETRFEDGTEVRDWWDGRDAGKQLTYTSKSRATSVSVDPEAMLVLDADRTNNTMTLKPVFSATGARLALQWVMWLQDLMLTYSALA